jgi:DNA-dependent metalloprotease WSS1
MARLAAERRRTLSAGSGQKLGGAPLLRGSDVRKVIADAAQRRIDVTNGCASGSSESEKLAEEASKNGFRTKAEEDDANERAVMQAYIEMIQEEEKEKYGSSYIPPSQQNPAGPRSDVYPKSMRPPPIPTNTKPLKRFASSGALSDTASDSELPIDDSVTDEVRPWNCQICTLENPPAYLCCDACGTERPALPLTAQSRLVADSAKTSTKRETSKPRSRLASEAVTDSDASRVLSFKSNTSKRIAGLDRAQVKKPLGWLCHVCGAFMETEWWTCSACGTMKAAS